MVRLDIVDMNQVLDLGQGHLQKERHLVVDIQMKKEDPLDPVGQILYMYFLVLLLGWMEPLEGIVQIVLVEVGLHRLDNDLK